MSKQFIGVAKNREFIEVELNENGTIRGFNGFDHITKDRSADGLEYLSMCMWTHEVTIKGKTFKTGEMLPKKLPSISKENKRIFEEACQDEGFSCYDCGMFHDSDQYVDLSYVVVDSEIYCKECVSFADLVKPLNDSSEFFKAPDVTNIDVPKDFEEVATLFCDSSGFGSSNEPALTESSALAKVEELLIEHGPLFVGITGIGQFQVYVTLWKRN